MALALGAAGVGGCNLLAGIGELPYPGESSDGGSDAYAVGDSSQPVSDARDTGGEPGDVTAGDAGPVGDAPGEAAVDSGMAEAAGDASETGANDAPSGDGSPIDLAAAYFVQVGANTVQGTGTPTLPVVADLPADVRAHDTLLIAADFTTSAAPVLTDTQGNTIVPVVGPFGDGNGVWAALWYVADALPGTDAVTATLSSGTINDYVELYVHEYTGLHGLDSATDATGTSTVVSSGPFSTSQDGDLLFAYVATGSADVSAPYVARSTYNANLSEDTLAGPAGSYRAVARMLGGGDWIIMAAAFKTH